MRATPVGKKHLQLLGKLLMSRHPDIAATLITQIPTASKDFDSIPSHFQRFCSILAIQPHEYTGPVFRQEKVDIRRLFVAVMIHVYSPQSHHHPSDTITFTHGIIAAVAHVLKIDRHYSIGLFREVVLQEKVYVEFREKVAITKELLINANPS